MAVREFLVVMLNPKFIQATGQPPSPKYQIVLIVTATIDVHTFQCFQRLLDRGRLNELYGIPLKPGIPSLRNQLTGVLRDR